MTNRVVIDGAAVREVSRLPGVMQGLQSVGDQVAERAAQNAPKDSGAGAASIHCETAVEDGEAIARVGPDPDHFYMTAFVELGTTKMPARPFLRPALDGTYNL